MSSLKSRAISFFDVLLLSSIICTVLEYRQRHLRHDDDRLSVCVNYTRGFQRDCVLLLRSSSRIIRGLFVFHLPFSGRDATRSPELGEGLAQTAAIGYVPSRETAIISNPGSRVTRADAVSSDSVLFFWTPFCQQIIFVIII